MSDDIYKLIGRLRSYARSSKADIFAAVDTIEALRAERDRLKAALDKAGQFIADEYADPRVEPDGEWLAREARPIYAAICEALEGDADLLREDAHERKRIEKEYPWKE